MALLEKLFSPGKIGKLEIKNRILQAPMGTFSYDDEGVPSQQTIDYFVERAKGGVGLIICHAVRASAESRVRGLPNLYEDKHIPMMAKIADAIHGAGAKCALQLNHSGKAMTYQAKREGQSLESSHAIGPSAIKYVKTGVIPREMSKQEIHLLVEQFSDTARRVMQAGYDMVELHAAHGYLMSNFLSPFTNRRTDEYGGNPENRARFICEIIERIRDKCDPDFPVSVRFNGADFLSGGVTLEDALIQAKMFEKAGANLLHISAGAHENTEVQFLSYLWPDAYLTDLAAQVKRAVRIPVCTVGKLGDPFVANRILDEEKADFIALARPLLADPYWPQKVKVGKIDEINRCVYCNNCVDRLLSTTKEAKRLFCTVNPSLFREKDYAIKRVSKPKKVMVIGGGIAGMQAAKVAAQRGHSVILYETSGELGGAWRIASRQPDKEIYHNLIEQLIKGLKEAEVKIILNKKVDATSVKAEKPDALIVATGARPMVPDIPGADGPNIVQAVDLFLGKEKAGKNVVVIGGRMVGMEVACYLAEQGKKVSLITLRRLGENGRQLEENIYRTLRDKMIKHGIQILSHTPALEIRPDGVFANDGGNILWLPADTVVLAVGYRSENGLVEELKGIVSEIYSAGDCNSPRDGLEATREGMEVGLAV
jgi:2,4-dienoyl-CoA reductase-like NADH-dependent reductase (Old Yellow Enzyme family)/thioredoxin reductase